MRAKRSSPKTNKESQTTVTSSSGNGKPTIDLPKSSLASSANPSAQTNMRATPTHAPPAQQSSPSVDSQIRGDTQRASAVNGSSAPTTVPTQTSSTPSEPSLHLSQLIDQYDTDASLSHAVVARLVVEDLAQRPDGWELATPAINAYVNSRRRFPTRKRERQIIPMYTPGDGTVEARSYVRELSLAQLEELADETVNFQRQRIRAGAMTTAQWIEKIQELELSISKRQDTVIRYELVHRTLESIGVESIDAALSQGRN